MSEYQQNEEIEQEYYDAMPTMQYVSHVLRPGHTITRRSDGVMYVKMLHSVPYLFYNTADHSMVPLTELCEVHALTSEFLKEWVVGAV